MCPPAVFDESATLQATGGKRDGRPASTDHVSEKLLSEVETGVVHAVPDHEEPTRQPFFDLMKAVASCNLGYHQALTLNELKDPPSAGLQRS